MYFGGLQKTTLIDYPEKVACVIFTIGCNFRCPFCYSPELVLPEKIKNQPVIKDSEILNFLKKRKGKLDGVVICGGEPTIQKDLDIFLKKLKKIGYLIKIDTNGYLPEIIKKLLKENLLDYVAMDIKAPKEKYERYTGTKIDIKRIENSIKIIKSSNTDYEFRTTVAPGISKEDIIKIADWIAPAKKYFLQEFFDKKEIIDPEIKKLPTLKKEEIKEVIKEIKNNFEICKIR